MKIIQLIVIILILSSIAKAENPYSEFGAIATTLQTEQERNGDFQVMEINNPDSTSLFAKIRFDFSEMKIYIFGKTSDVIEELSLEPTYIKRFISEDPLSRSFPYYSPYLFAANTPINGIDYKGLRYIKRNNPNTQEFGETFCGEHAISVGNQTFVAPIVTFNGEQYFDIGTDLYWDPDNGVSTSGDYDELITKMFVTKDELEEIFPNGADAVLTDLTTNLNRYLDSYNIRSANALAHFLGQAGHETGGFTRASNTENLNYTTASRIVAVWSTRFTLDKKDKSKLLATLYTRNPSLLANTVYSNRLGNGDISSGDGWFFRGRGIFQLTGRTNYTNFQNSYNASYDPDIDIVSDPGLIASNSRLATVSALWFFKNNILDEINILNATVRTVTRRVNGGIHGLTDRTNYYNQAVRTLD